MSKLACLGRVVSVLGAMLSPSIGGAQSPPLQELDAVAMIRVFAPSTGQTRKEGSGMLLGPDGFVLTARHVVGDVDRATERITVTFISASSNPIEAEFRDCAAGESDVCLLKIPASAVRAAGVTAFPRLNRRRLEVNDMVLAVGWPNPANMELDRVSGTITGGLATGVLYPTSATALPGMSGGPVYDQTDTVVGLVKGGLEPTQTRVLLVPLFSVRDLIDQTPVDCSDKEERTGPVTTQPGATHSLDLKRDGPVDSTRPKIGVFLRAHQPNAETELPARLDLFGGASILGTAIDREIYADVLFQFTNNTRQYSDDDKVREKMEEWASAEEIDFLLEFVGVDTGSSWLVDLNIIDTKDNPAKPETWESKKPVKSFDLKTADLPFLASRVVKILREYVPDSARKAQPDMLTFCFPLSPRWTQQDFQNHTHAQEIIDELQSSLPTDLSTYVQRHVREQYRMVSMTDRDQTKYCLELDKTDMDWYLLGFNWILKGDIYPVRRGSPPLIAGLELNLELLDMPDGLRSSFRSDFRQDFSFYWDDDHDRPKRRDETLKELATHIACSWPEKYSEGVECPK